MMRAVQQQPKAANDNRDDTGLSLFGKAAWETVMRSKEVFNYEDARAND